MSVLPDWPVVLSSKPKDIERSGAEGGTPVGVKGDTH